MDVVDKILGKLKRNDLSVSDDIALNYGNFTLNEQVKIDKETSKMQKRLKIYIGEVN